MSLKTSTATKPPSWACFCGSPENRGVLCQWCGEHQKSGEVAAPLQCKPICTLGPACSFRQRLGERHFLHKCQKLRNTERREQDHAAHLERQRERREQDHAAYLERQERRERREQERRERREQEHAEYLVRQARRERRQAEKKTELEEQMWKFHEERKERLAHTKAAPKVAPTVESTRDATGSKPTAASRCAKDADEPVPMRIVVGSFVGDASGYDLATGRPTYEPPLPEVEVVQFIRDQIVAKLPVASSALIDDVFCCTRYSRTGFIQLVHSATAADLSKMVRLIKALNITVFGNPGMKPLWCRPDDKERAPRQGSRPSKAENAFQLSDEEAWPTLAQKVTDVAADPQDDGDKVKVTWAAESDAASTAADSTIGDDWTVPEPAPVLRQEPARWHKLGKGRGTKTTA